MNEINLLALGLNMVLWASTTKTYFLCSLFGTEAVSFNMWVVTDRRATLLRGLAGDDCEQMRCTRKKHQYPMISQSHTNPIPLILNTP